MNVSNPTPLMTWPPPVAGGVRHSDTFVNLAKSLVAAQADLPAVTKDSVNPHFRNKYASLDAVVEAVRGPLAKHGLAIVQGATSPAVGAPALTVETLLVHQSGEWLSNTVTVPMAKVDPQGAGGALTYGRRYGLAALLSLATEEDDDANAASRPAGAARDRAPQAFSNKGVPPKRDPAKPAVPKPPATGPKATKAQVADIEALMVVLVEAGSSSQGIVGQMIADYGTPDTAALSRSQADELLERLKSAAKRVTAPAETIA